MSLQDDFINGGTACMNPTFTFPAITDPGLPNFLLASFKANLAGINYILNFIPPSVDNPPSVPSINLFQTAFMAVLNVPTIPGFDPTSALKLVDVCIKLPFNLIKNMITDLLNLQVTLPTLAGIEALFLQLAADAGLSSPSISQFAGCLAGSIFSLFQALI